MTKNKRNSKPRKEDNVRKKIARWLVECHPAVEIQKEEYAKLIEETGEKKIIDATLIGRYKMKVGRRRKDAMKGMMLSELEFEEHQADYSILKDQSKITFLLRKLAYWRADIPQYWIKIDKDGTPFMINFRHVHENRGKLVKMGRHKHFTKPSQLTRIIAAEKDENGNWPEYVIIGWDDLLKELDRIIKLGGF